MSIFKRTGKNSIRYVVKYKDSSGKWQQKSFRDEPTATAFDMEQNADSPEDNRPTLGELVILYMESRPDLGERTRNILIWLLADGGPGAFMRDKYADALSRRDLELLRMTARQKRPQGITNNAINHYQAHIHAVLVWGADQALIGLNPWRDFKRLKIVKPAITATLEDFQKVYACLPPHFQWAFKTAFCLALRPGIVELFNLKWSAFDWVRQFVTVKQGKSGRLKTVFPPRPYMAEAALRFAVDQKNKQEYVCHYPNGKHVSNYRGVWTRACKRAGVILRPYDVRHLAASCMLAAGADLAAVAAQLGHASVTTTGSI